MIKILVCVAYKKYADKKITCFKTSLILAPSYHSFNQVANFCSFRLVRFLASNLSSRLCLYVVVPN